MVQQASRAILAAYEDAVTRQWVRLRLDLVSLPERLSTDQWQWDAGNGWRPLPLPSGGVPALHEATLPMVEKLANLISVGETEMRDLRIALLDAPEAPDMATLLYREAEDPKEDVALVYLAGRPFAVADTTGPFLTGMGKRLVVMLNSEDAASTFKVDNNGLDFALGSIFELGAASEFCRTFATQTYHYSTNAINGWTTLLFRAYPNPWELYVEDVYDQLIKLREFDEKPNVDDITRVTTEYEEAENVSPTKKREKALRDAARNL